MDMDTQSALTMWRRSHPDHGEGQLQRLPECYELVAGISPPPHNKIEVLSALRSVQSCACSLKELGSLRSRTMAAIPNKTTNSYLIEITT
ncbi:hypothetical protein [Bradyrhizobium yuanmingense]|uniref:hypothetical protein n=1 Tax=Bradyrhizobium yuanmingense TaxID=108015 RepID=UPI0023B974FC|nr:hypothetical protein [Bradyrhizobium yuanmingense]MDF0492983.1 hypothetical protein [Bradyrhizobium yuanmingense]